MSTALKKTTAALLATGLFAFSSVAMATNGYFTHGVGTDSKAMGGTGVGSSENMGAIAAATNPLTILAVGLYGEALPNPNGAPIRLVVPWKYGFKGIKSIVRISFVEKQPPSSWNIAQPWEYGFYANVNPEVDHPRWSQARERRIGSGRFASKQPTLMFNGYGEHVAHLYKGLDLRKNY